MKTSTVTNVRQKVIDKAKAGDFTLFHELGEDLGLTFEDIGFEKIDFTISVPINKEACESLHVNLEDVSKYISDKLSEYLGSETYYHYDEIFYRLKANGRLPEGTDTEDLYDQIIEVDPISFHNLNVKIANNQ